MKFDCPKCGEQTSRLIAGTEIGCDSCLEARRNGNNAVLHRVKFHKWGNRMTIADAMRIKTNKKREDGQYRPDPRWRTSGD